MLYTAILGKGQYSNYSFYEMLTASKLLYCLESFRQPHKIIDIKIYKKNHSNYYTWDKFENTLMMHLKHKNLFTGVILSKQHYFTKHSFILLVQYFKYDIC